MSGKRASPVAAAKEMISRKRCPRPRSAEWQGPRPRSKQKWIPPAMAGPAGCDKICAVRIHVVVVEQGLAHTEKEHAANRVISLARMARTCASISHTARLRTPPPGRSRPVAQKSHARAQPNCELIHKVYFAVGSATNPAASPRWRRSLRSRASSGSGSGMRTDSIKPPSGRRNRYFHKTVRRPPAFHNLQLRKDHLRGQGAANRGRKPVIPPTLATPSRCTAAKTRAALARRRHGRRELRPGQAGQARAG